MKSEILQQRLRHLPSVDALIQAPALQPLVQVYGHGLAVDAARSVLDAARRAIVEADASPSPDELVEQMAERIEAMARPSLHPVINATGIVIHTNLGRAPLCESALAAMVDVGRGYSNLEYDLEAGQRGSRYTHAEALLRRLTGAEAALVVNNNAGAVLLALSALARDREVVISRGQLVEIGGGFRIPDVMRQSGARLVEVGATNRTHLRDYEQAIGPETAMLLVVHQSNFRLIGFTSSVPAQDLVALARQHNLVSFHDLGSGTLLDTQPYGFAHEPTVQETVAAGFDLVSFSGDKLLGTLQAGILVGRAALIAQLRQHPLTRALRVDKTTLAGLQATLLHYVRGDAVQAVPVWRMLAAPLSELDERARSWVEQLRAAGLEASVLEGRSATGGGSLPGETIPTRLVCVQVPAPDAFAARLRAHNPPVVVRIEQDRLCLDPRTVLPDDEQALLAAILDVANIH